MRIFLAAAMSNSWDADSLAEITDRARADRVGRHVVAADPDDADIVLFVNPHQYVDDPLMRHFRAHRLARERPRDCYVFDESDSPLDLFPGVYTSMPRKRFNPRRHRTYAYPRLITDTRAARERKPDLLFSFTGRSCNALRRRILQMRVEGSTVEDSSRFDHFSGILGENDRKEAAARYLSTMSRSHFVLCPRGVGTSSYRLFETLAAGRVPVILSDEWVPPDGVDWGACSVTLPESISTSDLIEALEAITPSWPAMSQCAAAVYDTQFDTGVWFHSVVEKCLDLNTSRPGRNPAFWRQGQLWRKQCRQVRRTARRGSGRQSSE